MSLKTVSVFPTETYLQIIDAVEPHVAWLARGVCRCWKAHIEKKHVDGWLKFTRLWIGTGVAAFQTRRLPCTRTEESYTDAQFHYGRIDGAHAVFHRRAGSEVTPNQLARFLHPTSI